METYEFFIYDAKKENSRGVGAAAFSLGIIGCFSNDGRYL